MKHKLAGTFSLLAATVIWGGAFVAQSAGMELIGPFTFQAIRCALAVLALVIFIALMEAKQLSSYLKKWADPKLWKAGILCGLALFVASGLQQIGLVYTDAGKAGFLTAMYIVIVPLFGLFFRRKPTVMALISIVVAVGGMYMLCCTDVTQINIGDVLLMLCAVAFAAQITLVDRLAGNVDSLRLNCVQALVVTVLSVAAMLFTETVDIKLVASCAVPLLYAGVLSMGVGYSLQIIGQKRVEPTTASLIMSLESVFALVFGALLLGERLTASESIGCVLVFVSVVLSQIPQK